MIGIRDRIRAFFHGQREEKMIIGLDVGGTHTDVVLLGNAGVMREIKVPTDQTELFPTVLEGMERITEGIDPKGISRAVLSTTLSTNAIVQGKSPSVGMIVSAGPGIDPEFFRTNPDYYPVSGSIDHRGREVMPLDTAEVHAVAGKLKKAGIRNVGIVGKFSVRNPKHEVEIYEMIRESFGKIFLGHRISGSLNFPRRVATAYLNTAVRQVHKKFFEAINKTLAEKGLTIPIHILKADGGTMSLEASIDHPSQTILSGPAASVMGSIGAASPDQESLVLDIGGTTTDMAVLIKRAPLLEPWGISLGRYKTLIRSLETRSIGIGGDSQLRVEDGKLRIGPDRQGPALAYGGPAPTPTDALFVLNKGEDGDREKAVAGIRAIAEQLGESLEKAAQRIFDQLCRTILNEAEQLIADINAKPVYTVHELQEGHQVAPKEVLVLGGPAPYLAERLKEISSYQVQVVPRWKVANAIGAGLARTTCEVSLFGDTQQGIATAPEEKYSQKVGKDFSVEKAVQKAYELLKQKALQMGASSEKLEMETIEQQEFNMVRGFYTTGRNIRVKVQVKPGLIAGYDPYAQSPQEETDHA